MTQHLFIVTSAINTRFGKFTAEERLDQMLITLRNIKEKVPTAKIAVFESSGFKLDQAVIDKIQSECDWLVNMSNDTTLHQIQGSTENWDVVKNLCELMSFNSGLRMLEEHNAFYGVDRIHKLSGRYVLNDDFDVNFYDTIPDKIALTLKYTTQFVDMEVPYQYMSRLWSWPIVHHAAVKEFYNKAITEFLERLNNGRYIDIEHLMYYFLPPEHIKEIRMIGVEGMLGQNGADVNN